MPAAPTLFAHAGVDPVTAAHCAPAEERTPFESSADGFPHRNRELPISQQYLTDRPKGALTGAESSGRIAESTLVQRGTASPLGGTGGIMDEPLLRDREAPVGRGHECGLLDGVLDALPDRGAALLLCGEPGIGKSTLLDYVAGRAGARVLRSRVLRARGIESEAALPYTVLADLLLPLRKYFAEVPVAQCSALEGCLALADVTDPNPYAVCAGALGVLAAAGAAEPLLVLVDDLHWADPSSRRVLQFAARR